MMGLEGLAADGCDLSTRPWDIGATRSFLPHRLKSRNAENYAKTGARRGSYAS